jgi:hypothetical protein
MALPGNPVAFFPLGVTDSLEGSNAPKGSMTALANLVPDPSTRHLWQCRPAASLLENLALSIPGAGFISVIFQVGSRVYGMVASSAFPGHDQPFCYDVPSNQVIPITGATAVNTPLSPNAAGPWTPPSMAIVGSSIVISHPGYHGSVVAFGAINTLTPNALTYQGTNTLVNALIFPPSWVAAFNGRMFFLVNPPGEQPAVYMSDSLNALQITNANQILTFGDNLPLTVAAPLGLSNQLIGGVVQALIIFKGVSAIYQVTGDYALGNLAVNALNAATGTLAANTVASTEKGVLFMAPDGIRLIDNTATVQDPIGKDGQGVTVPFYNALNPTRSTAAYNTGLYRVQVQNGSVPGNPQQEWWYDIIRDVWSGPHTTGVSLSIPFGSSFMVTLFNGGAKLFQSDTVQSVNSGFVENGAQLLWQYQPTLFPEDDKMCEFCTIETTLHAQLPPISPNVPATSVSFIDQNGTVLNTVSIASTSSGSLWGVMIWGVNNWGGASDNLFPRLLEWTEPIVFRRGTIVATGQSSSQVKLGELRIRLQELGYLQPYSDIPNRAVFILGKDQLGGPHVLG